MSLIIPANSLASGGFAVDNSCRFNGTSDYLNKTFGSAGNRDKWTYSIWVKKCKNGVEQRMLTTSDNSTFDDNIRFNSDDTLTVICNNSVVLKTNRLFRDNSAFYHIVVIWDSGNGTAGDRCQLWVNGIRETSFSTASYPSLNQDSYINNNTPHYIGLTNATALSHFLNGYASEIVFLNAVASSPVDTLGEFDEDSGIWKPIDVSGLSFGTNGFYLDFENSGALGADVSGNTNNFTVNNLTAIDQSTDTCTNNFATFNSLIPQAEITYSEGNLIATDSGVGGNSRTSLSTIAPSSGKWYAEFKLITDGGDYPNIGIWSTEVAYVVTQNVGLPDDTYAWNNGSGGKVFSNNTTIGSTGVGTYAEGNIVQIALDLDNNYIYFGVNGTYITSGDPTSGASGTGGFAIASGLSYYFATTTNTNGAWGANFGGSPPYAISSGNTDGNGYGNFEYAVPANYYSLNTKNLAEYG